MHYFRRAGLLLPRDNLFDVVKLVQGFEWREVVDVETQDFVAYLTEYGVIELEEEEHPPDAATPRIHPGTDSYRKRLPKHLHLPPLVPKTEGRNTQRI